MNTRNHGLSLALIMATAVSGAQADVFDSYNENLQPGNFFWAAPSGTIGWYWTPDADVLLGGIQTKLATASNINNNATFTTTLYSDRPAAGGSELGSFTWNGTSFIEGDWLGGSFAAALALTGGTTYFVGMSGWEQSLFGGGGSGVNWIDPPDQPGGQSLGAGSGYTGFGFDTQMNTSGVPANIDSPILRFISVPAPLSTAILGLGGVMATRRRRG